LQPRLHAVCAFDGGDSVFGEDADGEAGLAHSRQAARPRAPAARPSRRTTPGCIQDAGPHPRRRYQEPWEVAEALAPHVRETSLSAAQQQTVDLSSALRDAASGSSSETDLQTSRPMPAPLSTARVSPPRSRKPLLVSVVLLLSLAGGIALWQAL